MIIKHYHEVLPPASSGSVQNNRPFFNERIDIGPAVVVNIGKKAKQEEFVTYDRFGRKKKF
jgi:hypothetical protein